MADTAYSLDNIQAQVQQFFQNLTFGKKLFLFSGLAGIIIGIAAFFFFTQQVAWTPLVSGLKQSDMAQTVAKLDEMNVNYTLQPGGATILVPEEQVDSIRLKLASSGLKIGGIVGFELFDKNNLGATEFQQKVQYQRALEGELVRLITQIATIETAKVTIAMPEKSLFINEEKPVTASVVIGLRSHTSLSSNGIETVLNLVAGAIPGLKPENVQISNTEGKLLSQGLLKPTDNDLRQKNYTYQKTVETSLEGKLLTQLEKIAGRDRVEVRVATQMDFEEKETTEDLIDANNNGIVSEEVLNEKTTGSRSIPVGVPGVASNSPEVRAGASEVANVSDLNKKQKRTNYINSKRHVKTKHVAGEIKKLSIAVLLDGKYKNVLDKSGNATGETEYIAWTPQELQSIRELAMRTVGFSEKRGDVITVQNIRFDKIPIENKEAIARHKQELTQFILDIVRYVVVAIVIILLIFFVIRPMLIRLGEKPEDLDLLMGLPTSIVELEGDDLEIGNESVSSIPSRDKIIELAKQDPFKTAALVRQWLKERKS